MDFGVSPLVLPKALKVFLGQISREKKITFPAWHQTLAGFLKFSVLTYSQIVAKFGKSSWG
jgi:hypothetical protein